MSISPRISMICALAVLAHCAYLATATNVCIGCTGAIAVCNSATKAWKDDLDGQLEEHLEEYASTPFFLANIFFEEGGSIVRRYRDLGWDTILTGRTYANCHLLSLGCESGNAPHPCYGIWTSDGCQDDLCQRERECRLLAETERKWKNTDMGAREILLRMRGCVDQYGFCADAWENARAFRSFAGVTCSSRVVDVFNELKDSVFVDALKDSMGFDPNDEGVKSFIRSTPADFRIGDLCLKTCNEKEADDWCELPTTAKIKFKKSSGLMTCCQGSSAVVHAEFLHALGAVSDQSLMKVRGGFSCPGRWSLSSSAAAADETGGNGRRLVFLRREMQDPMVVARSLQASDEGSFALPTEVEFVVTGPLAEVNELQKIVDLAAEGEASPLTSSDWSGAKDSEGQPVKLQFLGRVHGSGPDAMEVSMETERPYEELGVLSVDAIVGLSLALVVLLVVGVPCLCCFCPLCRVCWCYQRCHKEDSCGEFDRSDAEGQGKGEGGTGKQQELTRMDSLAQ